MQADDTSLISKTCLRITKERSGKKKCWVVLNNNKFVTAFGSKQEAITWLYVKGKEVV